MATSAFPSNHRAAEPSAREIARRVGVKIARDDVFGRAAELAYYYFLSLFPLLISVVAALSIFGFADKGRALLSGSLSGALPPSAANLISKTLNGIIQASGPLKMSVGVIGSIWAASAGMRAMMDTLDAAYEVEESRSLIKRYAIAVWLTFAIAVLLVIAILLLVFGRTLIRAVSPSAIVADIWKVVEWPVALAIMLLAFAVVYYFAPDLKNREWHWITPGAIGGLILWIIATIGLRVYLHFFNTYNATYGSLAAVIVLLLWFYVTGIAVLAGAVLNAVLEKSKGQHNSAREESPSAEGKVA